MSSSSTISCDSCKHLVDIDDLNTLYVVRTCIDCGRKINLREAGDNGHGIKVVKGDQFKFPTGWLQIAANPLKGNSNLTRPGLAWFAKLIFVEDIKSEADIKKFVEDDAAYADSLLRDSDLLEGLNIDSKEDTEEIIQRVKEDQSTTEWWALLVATFCAITKDAIAENDAKKAAWAMRAAERFRSMCVFKTHLEEVVWMGHSARRLVDVLKNWYQNSTNPLEEYWQQLFKENPYVLSQIFAAPVIFIGEKAYVGGMGIDRQDAKFVDYMYAKDSSNDSLLVELKTPVTRLLGGRYRKGVFKPSAELSGAVVQALDYRRELSLNIGTLTKQAETSIDVFGPRCVIVAGNASSELDSDTKRKSFELFRASLNGVEIVTYDELFKKAETLASLFNLVVTKKKS